MIKKIFHNWLLLSGVIVGLVFLVASSSPEGSGKDWEIVAPSEKSVAFLKHSSILKKEGSTTKTNWGPKNPRPNVLFVLTDDQPVSTLRVMTRTKQFFKKNGTVFPNHFVSTPICCPSRTTFLTGQYSHNTGVLNNQAIRIYQQKIKIKKRVVQRFPFKNSIACDLERFGYETAIFGKYINGWNNKSKTNPRGNIPTCFGPNSFIGFDDNNSGGTSGDLRDQPVSAPGSDGFLTQKTIEFIKKNQKPWFAFLSLRSPHLPLDPPNGYSAWTPENPYRPSLSERTTLGNDKKPSYVTQAVKKYDKKYQNLTPEDYALGQERMVKSVDDHFAKLVNSLRANKDLENTIIVFSSDNGYLWDDHGLHGKFYPYLDSVKTPLMISYPRRVQKGKIDYRLASNVDFAPTIYELTKTRPLKHKVDGYSLFGSYRRNKLLLESGANGVTPYWASFISHRFQYIETARPSTKTKSRSKDPYNFFPKNRSDIRFREFYRLENSKGNQVYNIYEKIAGPKISKLSRLLQEKAWRKGPREQRGCYQTINSGSQNPCL